MVPPVNNCIYCSSNDELNTRMEITVDGPSPDAPKSKITVLICDTHAEEATIKGAREAYLARKSQIDHFMEQAKALGITINTGASGLVTATTPAPAPAPVPQRQMREQPIHHQPAVPEDANMIDSEEAAQLMGPVKSVAGAVPKVMGSLDAVSDGRIESRSQHTVNDLNSKIEGGVTAESLLKGKVQLERVPGRQGQPITIPTKKVDGTGTTHIRINNTMTDQQMLKRTKDMAQATMHDQHQGFGPHGQGYDAGRRCPICRGTGSIRRQGREEACPKCDGSGMIMVL